MPVNPPLTQVLGHHWNCLIYLCFHLFPSSNDPPQPRRILFLFCFVLNTFIDVQLTYKIPYIFNVHNLLSLNTFDTQEITTIVNRYTYLLQKFPCVLLVLFCFCMVRTFNMRANLLTHIYVYNKVPQTIGAMLYSRCLELIHVA